MIALFLASGLLLPSADVASPQLSRIDTAVADAIERGDLPGAVILISHHGKVVYHKAFGNRAKLPEPEPMTLNTVFDLASLTKPIATASSVMLLVEKGQLKLNAPAAMYWPAFTGKGKENITLEHLLLHTSGLIADNALSDYQLGRDKAFEKICQLTPLAAPGERFIYSDVNYIVLGEIVGRVSGKPLDLFASENLFQPLGLKSLGFKPTEAMKELCAPTEKREGQWLRGAVHDPRAALLGGVAGHAGLFGTADDLAIFAQCLLDGGTHKGTTIFLPETVRTMTAARAIPGGLRTYGWDMATAYSSNRGSQFRKGVSFGHTGFTGTSLWIDPETQTIVIVLTNRVHPEGKGNVTRLRSQVATIAANVLDPKPSGAVWTGLDVLTRDGFAALKDKKVALVTNHTGLDPEGRAAIDLLHKAEGVTLVALFSPEHGIRGMLDAQVNDGKDEKTGLPVYSLYGKRRKPDAETLRGVDTLVYDIQDAGCRFYTYISTLGLVLEAAAEHKIKVIVLDRPNPIGGVEIEGPILDAGRESFVGWHPLPIRHGMTVGELARMFKAEKKLDVDLEVIKMEGWKRGDAYDETNLRWINPSPNLRSVTEAFLYPGIGLLETTNVSVGRGTDRPFEWLGAPWIDGRKLALELSKEGLPGVHFVPLRLTPNASVHKDKACDGVQFVINDRALFRPVRTGLVLATTLRRLYPEDWKSERYDTLLIHKATFEALKKGTSWPEIEKSWQPDLAKFRERRKPHLLYSE